MPVSNSPAVNPEAAFALLDDCDASQADPRSRLYTGYAGALSCSDASELPALFQSMQQALLQGKHVVGLFNYELGATLHAIAPPAGARALAQVLLFERCQRLSADQVAEWLTVSDAGRAGIAQLRASVTQAEFTAALEQIHRYIEAGDTYQVNYTYRLRYSAYGSPMSLYRRLRQRQRAPYGALVVLPDGRAVLSLSPELFVRHDRGELTVRPMKGTMAASDDAKEDAREDVIRSEALAADPKNRAENLMVLDLLRNDLGRIASIGSVQASQLFEVKRYGKVLQMTSTVRAKVSPGTSLAELFAALFPCGSITGAPKRRTMQIINELEADARGLYTGAIGWFDAPQGGAPAGDFCLSVPIRTLVLQAPDADGLRAGEMGVGAGIVYDSDTAEEYAECQLKARFLTGLPHDFGLFETMFATRAEGCRHLDLHLRRLQASAAYFGFDYDEAKIRRVLQSTCATLSLGGSYRVRLELSQSGACSMQSVAFVPWAGAARVLVAPHPVAADTLFLRHKTTVREHFEPARLAAEAQGAFDVLFYNAEGELTEGTRSNVFVKLDGRWYTPPLGAGLLPGVMRAAWLADPASQAGERRLTLDDLRAAEQVVVCNALHGMLPVTLDWVEAA